MALCVCDSDEDHTGHSGIVADSDNNGDEKQRGRFIPISLFLLLLLLLLLLFVCLFSFFVFFGRVGYFSSLACIVFVCSFQGSGTLRGSCL